MNIVHAHNPFNPSERALYFAPEPITIDAFLDKNNITFDRPTVCIVDGSEGLMRKDWGTAKTTDFKTIAFVTLPEGGGGGSNPLAMVAMLAVTAFSGGLASMALGGAFSGATAITSGFAFGLAKAAIMIGGMALINAIIPPPKTPSTQQRNYQSASPIYSLQAQGNSARLGSTIPKIYGTHPVYPDFAAQPYTEYNGDDQYLYQLFCIGLGQYDITNIRIEDTPIANFAEVEYEIINPGQAVTLFPVNVETSVEVSGQELLQNQYVGGFIANASGTLTNNIGFDIILPKGLFYANDDGGLDSRSVSYLIEYQPVDDLGVATGAYISLGSNTISGATVTPIRKSYRYTVPLGRYAVRATRTSVKSTDSRVGNDIQWGALKAYIPGSQSYGDVTLLAMRARATNNLSQTSSRRINLTASSLIKTWDSTNGWSASPVATSKPAWIIADICRSAYAGQMPEGRYSLLDLESLQTTLDARNVPFSEPDEFNGVFDNRMTLWEALQLVCKSVRAMPIIQGGVIHFIRDQAQTIPTAMFSMRNIVKGSFSSTYVLPGEETADAVEVEYFDRATMKPTSVLCELNAGQSTKPAKVKMFGVVYRDQAYREGMYLASANKNRRIMTTFETELEGYIPTVGDLVTVSHDMPDWGQSGEIEVLEDYTATQYRLHLSEPLVDGTGQHYIILRRKDGTATAAIACTVDAVDKTLVVIVKTDVDFTINDTDAFEHTHFAFGIAAKMYRRCRVIPPIKPKGGQKVEINLVNESDAVHLADTGITPALDPVFALPPPIVKPVITVLNITTGGTPASPKLGMSWTPASEADHYIIEWGINGLEWTRAGEATTNNYILSVTPNLIHVRVAAVGLVQGDWIAQTIDARLLATPGIVQNLALADPFTGTQAKIKWTAAARAHSYKVDVWSGAVLRKTVTTTQLEFIYTSEEATADGGPWRNLVFSVYGINDSGQSIDVADLAVNNPAPAIMTGVAVYAGYESLMLTYDPVADTDFAGVRVCMSTTNGFTPSDANAVYEGSETVITLTNLPKGITQYLRLAAYDDFGKDILSYTAQYSGIPAGIASDADITALQGDVTAAQSDITASQNSIATAQTDIAAAENNITASQGDIATAQTDIVAAENNITASQADIATAQSDIVAAEANIAASQGDITTSQNDIAAAQTDIVVAESNIAASQSDIATAQTDIVAAENNITVSQTDIATAQSDIVAAEANIVNAQANITQLQTDLAAATTPAQILTKLNTAIAAPGDNLILTADRFAVKLNGSDTYPLIIANVDGTDYVGIAADVAVQGKISATQLTAGSINAGTDISVGNGAMILDGNGALIVYAGDSTVANRNFAFLSGGELSFQRYFNNQYFNYKSVKRVEYGTADSGTTVVLPDFWQTKPKLIVSPNQLESYNVVNTNQSQTWHVFAQNLREDPAASGIYKFDAVAELILSSNSGIDNPNVGITQSAAGWSSPVYQLPANTAEITVSVSLKSKAGTGTDGVTYYYRNTAWRVYYHDTVTDTWLYTDLRVVSMDINLDNLILDSRIIALPANITEYYVAFWAGNYADNSTFTSGVQLYDYTTNTTGTTNQTLSQSSNSNFSFNYALADYITPAGWEVYQITYSYKFAISVMSAYLNTSQAVIHPSGTENFSSFTYDCADADAFGDPNTYRYPMPLTAQFSKAVQTNIYNKNYITLSGTRSDINNYGTSCGPEIVCDLKNAYATISLRQSINNSTTADNTFNLISCAWTLSGNSAITTGSLNYMAIEG